MEDVIWRHPTPEKLRQKLLDHLYEETRGTLPRSAEAVVFVGRRMLRRGEDVVEGVRVANEEIGARVRKGDLGEGLCKLYVEFVEEWWGREIDESLVCFLLFFHFVG